MSPRSSPAASSPDPKRFAVSFISRNLWCVPFHVRAIRSGKRSAAIRERNPASIFIRTALLNTSRLTAESSY